MFKYVHDHAHEGSQPHYDKLNHNGTSLTTMMCVQVSALPRVTKLMLLAISCFCLAQY